MPPTFSGSRALRADTTAVLILMLRAQNARDFCFLAFRRFKSHCIWHTKGALLVLILQHDFEASFYGTTVISVVGFGALPSTDQRTICTGSFLPFPPPSPTNPALRPQSYCKPKSCGAVCREARPQSPCTPKSCGAFCREAKLILRPARPAGLKIGRLGT